MSDTCPVCLAAIQNTAIDSTVRRVTLGPGETDPSAGTKAMHEGVWYYFDRMVCRNKFMANPAAYVERTGSA